MAKTTTRKSARAKAKDTTTIVEHIDDLDISTVMQDNYADYAAAVVVGRALPDVRDGMKPVHRRILYTMKVGRYDWNANYRKTAKIVGDCMGTFHPHGDSSIAEALARMTQPWSMSVPLIDGQGNFGSPDGDRPAAMRYTEARLANVSRFLLEEIDRGTVDFRPNYDETEVEPVVLPAAFPNILVNGGDGIAVGMASSIAPHNLGEVIDATLLRLRDKTVSLEDLMKVIPGPDFPTAGRVLGNAGIIKAYETGRGTLDIEATTHFEKEGRIPLIIYSDMPWGVKRPTLLAKINELILAGSLPDVVSARDETDRTGSRFVVELKAGADPEYIDKILKTQTPVRTSVSLNYTLLDGRGVPREMGLADILDEWIAFRRLTLTRRATFDLRRARDRGRLLLGRIAALSIIDKIVKMIRASNGREEAIDAICAVSFTSADFSELVELLGTKEQKKGKRFQLERMQAEDILAMRLQRLTGLERDSLEEESRKIVAHMIELREILSNPLRLDEVLTEELEAVRVADKTGRRTVIDVEATATAVRAAAPIAPLEKTFLIATPEGYYARAKKGAPEDMVCTQTEADTHSRLVFFTDKGMAYGVDVTDLPALEDKADPRAVPGLLGLTPLGETVSALLFAPDDFKASDEGGKTLTFVSKDGMVRRTPASEFARIPSPGKLAMKIGMDDPDLLSVFPQTTGGGAVLLATAAGKCIRFSLEDLRVMAGRSSRGVRGMKLEGGDRVVSAIEVPDMVLSADLVDEIEKGWLGKMPKKDMSEEAKALLDGPELVQLAATGHMKRTPLAAYRQTKRDNRGYNDKGPAKTIGEIVGLALVAHGAESIAIREATGVVILGLDGVRKSGKAATGGINAESPTGFL
jgi:DNA gyrase subunit A